jgi:hypothetical protein
MFNIRNTMAGRDLLKKLNRNGLVVSINDAGELKVKVRSGQQVDEQILRELRENKQHLLKYVQEQSAVQKLKRAFLASKAILTASPGQQTVYEASHQQRKEYLRYLITGRNTSNVYFTLHFQDMEKEVIEAAVFEVFNRHESLRATFCRTGDGGVTVISRNSGGIFPIEFLDLRQGNMPEMGSAIRRDIESTHFDFEKSSLVRVKLLALPEQEYMLVFILHHAISDDDSVDILKREIGVLCESFKNRLESPLPPVKTQFSDYASWINSWIESEEGKQHRTLYRNGIMESLEREQAVTYSGYGTRSYRAELNDQMKMFLGERNISQYQDAVGAVVTLKPLPGAAYVFFIDEQLTHRLHALAANCSSTFFMTLISAFVILLYETEGKRDIRVSIPFSTRFFDEFKDIVGWLTHNLIVCFEVEGPADSNAFITNVTEMILEASDFAVYPHELIMKDLDLPLETLAPAYINLVKSKEELITDLTPYHLKQGSGILPLKFIIKECKNGIVFKFYYQVSKYSSYDIELLGERFIEIIQRLTINCKTI